MADLDARAAALRAAEDCAFRVWEVSKTLTALSLLSTASSKAIDPMPKGEELACLLNVLARSLMHTHDGLEASLSTIERTKP